MEGKEGKKEGRGGKRMGSKAWFGGKKKNKKQMYDENLEKGERRNYKRWRRREKKI